MAALERLRRRVPADLPFIADAKRGDIGSTAERQATAIFNHLGADAVTSSPYLGRDAVAPFLQHDDRFVYVLCRTSNPGAGELQDTTTSDGEPLYLTRRTPRLGLGSAAAHTRPCCWRDGTRRAAARARSRARAALPGAWRWCPGRRSGGSHVGWPGHSGQSARVRRIVTRQRIAGHRCRGVNQTVRQVGGRCSRRGGRRLGEQASVLAFGRSSNGG